MKRLNTTFLALALFVGAMGYSQENHAAEVSEARYIGGGITGIFVGFGIGHAVQGRYGEKGWLFTVTQAAALGITIAGYAILIGRVTSKFGALRGQALQDAIQKMDKSELILPASLMAVGGISHLGFRIWEVVDLWASPTVVTAGNYDFDLQNALALSNTTNETSTGLKFGFSIPF